MKTAEK